MDKLEAAKLVEAGTRRPLLSNLLVVIEPADEASIFTTPFEPIQLSEPDVRLLSLANVDTVPAGRYAKAWLESRGVWSDVADRILPGVDVRAALSAVESAGAQAGIVYRTDAAHSSKVRIAFAVPIAEGPKISYPVAAIGGTEAGRAYLEFLGSNRARVVWEREGFIFVEAPAPVQKR